MESTEDSGCLAQRQKLLEGGEDLNKLHRGMKGYQKRQVSRCSPRIMSTLLAWLRARHSPGVSAPFSPPMLAPLPTETSSNIMSQSWQATLVLKHGGFTWSYGVLKILACNCPGP